MTRPYPGCPIRVDATEPWQGPARYYARAFGPYRGGGNPVLGGPYRDDRSEAELDAEYPERITFRVIGYLCG